MLALISIAHLHQLLGLARVAGVSGVLECEDILMFGCAHVVNSSSSDTIQSTLKQLCIQWKSSQEI
jgi:succinate-acetate transporter protein